MHGQLQKKSCSYSMLAWMMNEGLKPVSHSIERSVDTGFDVNVFASCCRSSSCPLFGFCW